LTDQQILAEAINKAISNGWKTIDALPKLEGEVKTASIGFDGAFSFMIGDSRHFSNLFNHTFAKALWGEESLGLIFEPGNPESKKEMLPWKFHLQQMVIADDPIKYLEGNI